MNDKPKFKAPNHPTRPEGEIVEQHSANGILMRTWSNGYVQMSCMCVAPIRHINCTVKFDFED